MIKREHSKENLFLIELMINIVFFFILVTFCFRFFVKTETMIEYSADQQFAVYSCENIAAIYKSGDGSFSLLKQIYPGSTIEADQWVLYFDKEQKECSKEKAYYVLEAVKETEKEEPGTLTKVNVSCQDQSGKTIHQIEVCHYTALHPDSVKGGKENE